jgi:lysozyme
MKTSEHGIDLIKRFEGCRLTAYPDPATGGEPYTCGWGITSAAGVGIVDRHTVWTEQEAHDKLVEALGRYEHAVLEAVKHPLTQNQFDACVSLCWNIGPTNFKHSSVVRHINEGRMQEAADSFLAWDKAAHHVMAGLHRRREQERGQFLAT